jgi:CRP-like cAMP-binding protein
LDANIQMRSRKQKRKTQLRLKARSKLKKTKAMSKIEAFAILTEIETEAMIDVMTRECHLMGEALCQQGQVADRFYVVMNGECGAFVNDKNGHRQVGTIPKFGFFGESSLLSKPGVDDIRNATVEVMSDSASLLVLTKIKFYELIDKGVLSAEILKGVKIVDKERQEQNLGESRNTGKRIDTVEAGEGEKKTKKNEEEVDKSHV